VSANRWDAVDDPAKAAHRGGGHDHSDGPERPTRNRTGRIVDWICHIREPPYVPDIPINCMRQEPVESSFAVRVSTRSVSAGNRFNGSIDWMLQIPSGALEIPTIKRFCGFVPKHPVGLCTGPEDHHAVTDSA
jgi:hypothetical protein